MHHRVEIRVRYAETDRMGIVYHAHYLIWCEIGRTELMRALGVTYAALEEEGTMLAVSDAALRFHASARYDDLIAIETSVQEVRSRSVTFSYLISRMSEAQPKRLVTARTTLVALDRSGRPRKIPSDVVEVLRRA